MRKLISFLILCALLFSIFSPITYVCAETTDTDATKTSPQDKVNMDITATSAVLIEGVTGRILYEKDKDKKLIPASITKIMTLLLIFEALDSGKIALTDTVTVSEYAAKMGGSQVYLEPGETQTVDDMIKCITIASANDAAVAMAEFICGSESEFVGRMNEKAAELGMENTHFLNCNGLDDDIESGHYSSAYDVALMSRELIMNHPDITKYSTTWMDSITHTTKKGTSEFGLTNTNKLVRSYNGITGLKTGSTSKAKYCLSATASRNDTTMIAVIMAAPEPKIRFSQAATLLDYGFANTTLYKDTHEKFKKPEITISHATCSSITAVPKEAFSYTCIGDENPENITSKVSVKKSLHAPVKKGQKVGEIQYFLNDTAIGTTDLICEKEIPKTTFVSCLLHLLRNLL